MHLFSLKIYTVLAQVINDVMYCHKSVNTHVHDTLYFLLHDIIHWKTVTSYDA